MGISVTNETSRSDSRFCRHASTEIWHFSLMRERFSSGEGTRGELTQESGSDEYFPRISQISVFHGATKALTGPRRGDRTEMGPRMRHGEIPFSVTSYVLPMGLRFRRILRKVSPQRATDAVAAPPPPPPRGRTAPSHRVAFHPRARSQHRHDVVGRRPRSAQEGS